MAPHRQASAKQNGISDECRRAPKAAQPPHLYRPTGDNPRSYVDLAFLSIRSTAPQNFHGHSRLRAPADDTLALNSNVIS